MSKEIEHKSNRFLNALREVNLHNIFEVIKGEEGHVFRAVQDMSNGRCAIFVFIDDSPYTTIEYAFAKLENVGRKEKVLNLLNDINMNYKALTFFVSDDNNISSRLCYIADNDKFDPSLLVMIMHQTFLNIQDAEYSKIMRVIWS